MILSFHDRVTEHIFDGISTKKTRRRLPTALLQKAQDKLDRLNTAERLEDLRVPPGHRLETLSGDRAGQHSIRIYDRYRLCFVWTPGGPERVEVVDYH